MIYVILKDAASFLKINFARGIIQEKITVSYNLKIKVYETD